MIAQLPTLTLEGKTFVLLEQAEYERLRTLAQAIDESKLPPLPQPDADGNYLAIPYARASLARKLIRRRRAAGLTQGELAKQAKVRLETVSRIERAESSPDVGTVEKIVRALEKAELRASSGKPYGTE
jgi:DNA-binding XRE family transcriptional regulator